MQDQLNFIFGEIRSAMRFRWIGLGAAWLLCAGGWVYVAAMPDVYEAEARFFLDTSSLLAPVLEDQIIATDPEAQLAYIRESLLGRAELESVARLVGLDAGMADDLAYEAMLNRLRDDIVFEAINPAAIQGAPNRAIQGTSDRIYNLEFRHVNRERAIAVVEALLNTFIEGALGESRRNEDEALVFVEESIATRDDELRRRDREISDFKRANADRLPGAQGEYFARLQSETEELAEARRRLRSLEARRAQHREQLARLRESIPSSQVGQSTNSLIESIRQVQREVDELRLRYTNAHPDVIARTALLADLKRQRAEELESLGLAGSDLELLELESNPVYQEAQIALNETELGIAELETEITERAANMANLESLIDESLDNEARLAELERDYEVINEEYLELVRSRQSLVLTLQASATEQLDFRSIDEPNAPLTPVEPNRLVLLFVVFVGALGAAAAACYVLSQLRPVFNSARALTDFAELPVIGTVSNAWPVAEKAELRRSMLSYSAVFALLVLAFAGIVGYEMVGPGIHAPFERG